VIVVSAVVVVGAAGDAHAAGANDAAAAEALFSEGKRLMSAGQFAAACPKFAESQRLDPGVGTMLWLGECYGKNGQTASSWAIFHEAEALAAKTKDPRMTVAREEAAKLEPKLSKIVIDVAAISDQQSLEIKRDGVLLGKPLWGTPTPIDPGEHSITASAPQKKTWQGKVNVPASGGSTVSIKIPELEAGPIETPPVGEPGADGPAPGRTQRILGLVVGGVGIVGLGVGTYFGLQVKSKKDDSEGHCNGNLCDQAGVDARNDARSLATISDIAFIAGGALVIGGVVIYLTAPSSSSRPQSAGRVNHRAHAPEGRVGIRPMFGGAALQGTF
jgi:hypothetical protein